MSPENQTGLPLRPAEDLAQYWSEHLGGGCTSLVVRVHLVAPIIFTPIGVGRRSGAPKGIKVQQVTAVFRRGTSPGEVALPVHLAFGVGAEHRSRGHEDRHAAVLGAVSAPCRDPAALQRQAAGSRISEHIKHDISAYLITITIMNAAVGLATALAMWLCGLGDPILWGVVAFSCRTRGTPVRARAGVLRVPAYPV
jgi:hypothetical protein